MNLVELMSHNDLDWKRVKGTVNGKEYLLIIIQDTLFLDEGQGGISLFELAGLTDKQIVLGKYEFI